MGASTARTVCILWALSAVAPFVFLSACGTATRRPDGDGDSDGDVDGDADGDADGDSDADCEALREALIEAFEAAVLCNPAMSSLQCDGLEMMTNQCGCPWAANNRQPDLAQAARDAWEPYAAAGCIPETCGSCRDPTPTFRCVPLPIGTDGTCEIDD